MATLYIDLENGNDNYAGTSFAPLAQGTDGRTNSQTFSSAGATFPNDGSLIGQYLSIFNGTLFIVHRIVAWVSATSLTIESIGSSLANITVDRQYYIGGRWKSTTFGATNLRTAPGDTIRIMGSPAPTSLGQNGMWTSQALQATRSVIGATNATPISITSNSHGYSTGDTVVIAGDTGNTAANGTWEITVTGTNTFTLDGSVGNGTSAGARSVRLRNNTVVRLTSPVTQNIASTGPRTTSWTGASVNVSPSRDISLFKEHQYGDSINVQTAFTTGKAAYYTLPSTLDLSSYQQVSFWLRVSNTLSSGSVELRLCSDTTGDTVVNTISIPVYPSSGRWTPITIDTGAALGSSIASLSIFVNTDLSTSQNTVLTFNNIIACKASSEPDSLTLTSLIGKNTTGETWWGIQSINGTRVMLDADTNATPVSATVRGYYGTSETVTTWKRETIKLGPATGSTTALQTIQESGTDGSPITYSGGWNRTDMSTQTLETWLDGQNGLGTAFFIDRSFMAINNFSVVRANSAFSLNSSASSNNLIFGSINNNSIGAAATSVSYFNNIITADFICASGGSAYSTTGAASISTLNITYGALSNASNVFNIGSGSILNVNGATSNTLLANNGGAVFLAAQSGACVFKNLKIQDTGSATSVTYDTGVTPFRYFVNCLFGDTTEAAPSTTYIYSQISSQDHDQTVDNHKIFMDNGLISSAIDERKTASGISWKLQPTSATVRTSLRPVALSLAKVACTANSLVTVKAWMRRTNSGLNMRLVCKGGQIAGVASDVVSAMTAAANTWEELTITFTPTEVGAVEITAQAWGGSTFSGWVDDMTITQA